VELSLWNNIILIYNPSTPKIEELKKQFEDIEENPTKFSQYRTPRRERELQRGVGDVTRQNKYQLNP